MKKKFKFHHLTHQWQFKACLFQTKQNETLSSISHILPAVLHETLMVAVLNQAERTFLSLWKIPLHFNDCLYNQALSFINWQSCPMSHVKHPSKENGFSQVPLATFSLHPGWRTLWLNLPCVLCGPGGQLWKGEVGMGWPFWIYLPPLFWRHPQIAEEPQVLTFQSKERREKRPKAERTSL